jgi:hypothetical protein
VNFKNGKLAQIGYFLQRVKAKIRLFENNNPPIFAAPYGELAA